MSKKVSSLAISLALFLFVADFLPAQEQCGYSVYRQIETQHPYLQGTPKAPVVWSEIISEPGATWLKIHFSLFQVNDEDYVDLIDRDGNLRERIRGIEVCNDKTSRFKIIESPDRTVSFWGPAIDGDQLKIELHSISAQAPGFGFIIDEIGIGIVPIEQDIGILSVCGPDDRQNAACFEGTIIYTRAEPVGRMYFKSGGVWVLCTGSLMSCTGTNHFLTNQHCINSQAIVDTLEVRFHYQYTTCGGGTLAQYQTFYGDRYIKSDYAYDFCLLTLKNNPQMSYGCLVPVNRAPNQGESIYIPQHPGGNPKVVAGCNINNASVDAPCWAGTYGSDFNYFCDTNPGSSGSPVLVYSTLYSIQYVVLGLHHCGGCPNTAVKISKIYNYIKNDIGCGGAPPGAPGNLSASAVAYNQINLIWQDNSSNELGFIIQRKKEGGAFAEIARAGINATSYQDKSVSGSTTYYYRVKAYNGNGDSSWINSGAVTTPPTPPGVPPAPPSNLHAVGNCWDVQLTWEDNSDNENGFYIYRKTGDQYVQFDYVGPNITNYLDTDLFCGELWCYKVSAYNSSGESALSSSDCDHTLPCYQCEYPLSLELIPDKETVAPGESVTYAYKITNKGPAKLTDIVLMDDEFGIIGSGLSMEKGEVLTLLKTQTLTASTSNTAEVTSVYVYQNKKEAAKAKASATVKVKK